MTISAWGLAEVVRTHGRDRPDAPAITYGSEVVSWRRLDERSSRVADALVALGVGDRVVSSDGAHDHRSHQITRNGGGGLHPEQEDQHRES